MLEVLRSGQLSLGPRVPRLRGGVRRARSARATPARSRPAPPALHLALRAVGVSDGDEVVTSPFSFVASANAIALRARAAGVRRHRPGHAQPRPGGGRGGDHRPHDRAAAGPHLRLPGRHARRSSAHGLPIVEDACEALGARARRRRRGRRPRPPGGVRLLRQQAAHHRRGRDAHARLRRAQGARSTPSATRAARPTWAGSTTTGSASTTACRTSRARSGSPSSSGSTACSPTARAWPGWYREALARLATERGLGLPCEDAGGDAPRLVRVRRPAPARASTATATIVALRERGVQSKPYLPAIHLMSLLPRALRPPARASSRSAEDVAARSRRAAVLPGR